MLTLLITDNPSLQGDSSMSVCTHRFSVTVNSLEHLENSDDLITFEFISIVIPY